MNTVSSSIKICKMLNLFFSLSVFGEIHNINLEQRFYKLILDIVYKLRSLRVMFKLFEKDRITSFCDYFCRPKVFFTYLWTCYIPYAKYRYSALLCNAAQEALEGEEVTSAQTGNRKPPLEERCPESCAVRIA